jgi:uncharacterized protein (TIGR02453 family)
MISKDSLAFLDDLRKNNNRDWFLANKSRYEVYKKEYHGIISQMLEALKPKDPALKMLEVKNCTFRVNRDIRFSKDKSPYKTHMGMWFNTSTVSGNGPGYYIHIENGKSFIAGGFYQPEATELKRFRKEIAFFHDDLEAIITDKKFKSVFGDIDRENALKTSPKDYEKDHLAIDLLKLKSYTATAPLSDKDIADKDFVKKTADKIIALKPLNDFLRRALSAEDH